MPKRSALPNRQVVVVAYDGLATFEFGIAVEVFGLARPEMGADWYRFAVAAAEPGPLQAVGGVHLIVDGGLELLHEAGTIIFPGWRSLAEPVPPALLEAVRAAYGRGARLMSICSGAFILAAAGVLTGRRATSHWRYAEALAAAYPEIRVEPDVLYVDDGQVLTSAGSAAGIDLCLHVVRRDFGPDIANQVARRLVVPPHREGGQAQFIQRPVPALREGARVGPLLERMRARLDETQTIARLAREVGMSTRTFLRRFKAATGTTPNEWLIVERLRRARELLEGGQVALDDIALACGFGSMATMRHHFRARLATSPAAYRRSFRKEAQTTIPKGGPRPSEKALPGQ